MDPVILGTLLIGVSARALAVGLRGGPLWGLGAGAFTPRPALIGVGALLATSALFAKQATPLLAWLGTLAHEHPRRTSLVLALGTVLAVFALPDRTHFTGDFALRETMIAGRTSASLVYPQGSPLDLLLHVSLPRAIAKGLAMPASAADRLAGAIEAVFIGPLAVWIARRTRLPRSATGIVIIAIACSGLLALFTGYQKAHTDLALLGMLIAGCTLGSVTYGAAGVACSALALAAALHRAAALLIPLVLMAPVLAWRCSKRPPSPRELAACATLLVVAAAITAWITLPTAVSFDLANGYFGWPVGAHEWELSSVDVANACFMAAPLLLPLLLLLVLDPLHRRPLQLASSGLAWGACALPLASLPWLIRHSTQGLFRDWDMMACLLGALVVMVAVEFGARAARSRSGPLAFIVLMGLGVAPVLLQLGTEHDASAGLARARAFATAAPTRPVDVRARTLALVAGRYLELGDYASSVTAGRMAVSLAPSRGALLALAMAEKSDHEYGAALEHLQLMLTLDPHDDAALYNIVLLSAALGDMGRARSTLSELARLPDAGGLVKDAQAYIDVVTARRAARSAP